MTGLTRALWRDPQMRVLLCAIGLVAIFVPINYLMLRLTGWSALWPSRVWLTGGAEASADSWHVMAIALDWIRSNPDGGLYQAIFFEGQNKFQYAPTSLLPYVALEAVGLAPNAALLNGVNWAFIALTALGVGLLTHVLTRKLIENPATQLTAALFAGAATLLFYPVMMAYHLGQLQVWINMLFVYACLAWALERRVAAGVLIGLICLLKPQFGLFALWGLIRREWRFLLALCATGAVGLLISVLLFGFKNHLEYLSVLQFLSRHGEAYWANQSLNGLLHHLVGHSGVDWEAGDFPPHHPLVYWGSMLATLAILGAALSVRRGASALAGLSDFMLAALAFTAASPIAWEHHYGVLAPMFAALLVLVMAQAPGSARRGWLIALAVCFVFAANCFSFAREWGGPLVVLQTYLYFAALGVLVLLRRSATA